METKLRISVIVPVYNEEDTIEPCLDALFSQAILADEVIVVDNNSTDATVERLSAYQGRIILLRESRQGVHFARDTGMDAATGDVIGRIDADTRLPPQWIEQVHLLFADPTVDAVTGPAHYYDVLLPRTIAKLDLWLRSACARSCQQRLDWLFGANMAIRAEAWRTVRTSLCRNQDIHEDIDLAIHLYDTAHRIIFSPELFASTSARRIRDSWPVFRRYLKMTEHAYVSHPGQAARGALRRARVTNGVILLFYLPLNMAHRAYHARHQGFLPYRMHANLPPRKNPMSPDQD